MRLMVGTKKVSLYGSSCSREVTPPDVVMDGFKLIHEEMVNRAMWDVCCFTQRKFPVEWRAWGSIENRYRNCYRKIDLR